VRCSRSFICCKLRISFVAILPLSLDIHSLNFRCVRTHYGVVSRHPFFLDCRPIGNPWWQFWARRRLSRCFRGWSTLSGGAALFRYLRTTGPHGGGAIVSGLPLGCKLSTALDPAVAMSPRLLSIAGRVFSLIAGSDSLPFWPLAFLVFRVL
jgi:hypothetical protein